jgi:hypothetical protein
MSAKSATLAKSLHTVSVLVAIARHYQDLARYEGGDMSAAYAVESAVGLLGYNGASDPYGLAARAVAQLSKDVQP